MGYLTQHNHFFQLISVDFDNEKNQISLIQLILRKVYFKTTRVLFLKKCNNFLKPKGMDISEFSEFINGNGFIKLLNVLSNDSITKKIKTANRAEITDILSDYFKSLNIPTIINETAFIPINHDLLMYQALIIIDSYNKDISIQDETTKDLVDKTTKQNNLTLTNDEDNIHDDKNINHNEQKNKNLVDFKGDHDTLNDNKNSNVNIINNSENHVVLEGNEISNIDKKDNIECNENHIKKHKIKHKIKHSKKKDVEDNDDFNEEENDNFNKEDNDNFNEENKKESHVSFDKNENISLTENINSTNNILSTSFFESSEIMNFPKLSYINIVNNIMELNEMPVINSFSDFEKGSILPGLIEIFLNEKFKNIVENPSLPYDCLMNNMNALFILNKKDPSFIPSKYNITRESDIKKLIENLLMKYVFKDEFQNQMKEECNEMLNKFKISINNFNTDWKDGTNFVALLSILSNGEIAFPHESKLDINTLKDLFVKAKCALVLEDDAIFRNSVEYVILYQVKLILDEMRNKGMLKTIYNVLKRTGNKKSFIEINEDVIVPYDYVKDSFPVLRLLNFICAKVGLNFKTLDDVVNGLPSIVQYLMDIEIIPNVILREKFAKSNLNAVVNYLKDNNDAFKYSIFDFDDPKKREMNIIWFCDILLREFYIKNTKSAVFQNASQITGIQINLKQLKKQFIYGNYFYHLLDYENAEDKDYYDEELLLDLFQKAKVPFILDYESLTNINEDYICFQLKLIFDHSTIQFEKHLPKSNQIENNSQKVNIESNKVNDQPSLPFNENNESYEQLKKVIFNISDLKSEDSDDESIELNTDPKFSKIAVIPNKKSTKEQIINKLNQIFQSLSRIATSQKLDVNKNGKKNNQDKKIDLYRLYEYKEKKWVYDEQIIENIRKKYNMKDDDIIHFILLLPSCTIKKKIQKDEFYQLVSSISGCKIKGSITNDAYVELGICGNIKDIQKRFGISCIPNKNQEFLGLMQLRYPPSFENVKSIDYMQTSLSIISQYIVLTFPKNSIEEITHFINTSLYQIFQPSFYNLIEIGMTYLLDFDPSDIIQEIVELTQDKKFLDQIEIFLNQDEEILKTVKNFCDKVHTKVQWANEKYLDTYSNFLEIALHYCQKNVQKANKVAFINSLFKQMTDINLINDDQKKAEIINNSIKLYYNIDDKKENSFLKYEMTKKESNIIFDSEISDEFISSNGIDIKSLYTIFFCFSDPDDVKYVMKMFQLENYNQSYIINDKEFIANIQYCGDINELLDFYKITKTNNFNGKMKNGKLQLAYIFIQNLLPNNKKLMNDLLFFETMIASQCDIVITIPNKTIFEAQMHFAEKLMNAKNILDIVNKKNIKSEKCLFLINEVPNNINNSNIDPCSLSNMPFNLKKIELNITNKDSCSSFLKTLIDQLPNLDKLRKTIQFSDLQNDYNIFYVDIFQNIKKKMTEKRELSPLKRNNTFSNTNNRIKILDNLLNFTRIDDSSESTSNHDHQCNVISYEEYYILDIDFDETVRKVLYFFIKKKPKDCSVNVIEKYFIHTTILLRKEKDIIAILMKLKKKIMEKYVDIVAHDYIMELITFDMINCYRLFKILKIIKNSKIHFDEDSINYMKDYFVRRIENEIYNQAEEYCKDNEKSQDMKYLIGKRVYDLLEISNQFQQCRDRIQECYVESAKYKQEDVLLNQEEIGQESMKYVLSVKERIKEMTVEISREEDLEREIPQDF